MQCAFVSTTANLPHSSQTTLFGSRNALFPSPYSPNERIDFNT